VNQIERKYFEESKIDIKLVNEFKNMLNPPELVITQWKVLAILQKEKTDKDSLIKLVKSQTSE